MCERMCVSKQDEHAIIISTGERAYAACLHVVRAYDVFKVAQQLGDGALGKC